MAANKGSTDDYGAPGTSSNPDEDRPRRGVSREVLPATPDAEAEAERKRLADEHAEAVKQVADARALLAEAEAKEAEAAAAAVQVPHPEKEILVDLGDGNFSIVAIPDPDYDAVKNGPYRERVCTVSGRRCEHVSEVTVNVDGKPRVVWGYRAMR